MRGKKSILAAGLTAAAVTLSGVVGIQPASAAGWLGTCYPYRGSYVAGGWCDGNGPDWTYEAVVRCDNGGQYWGGESPRRWAGDRNGSYAECPAGSRTISGGLYYYYQGRQEGYAGS